MMGFAQNAGLFPHQLDTGLDRVLLVSMSEQEYRSASFLDNRLLQERQRAAQWSSWSRLAEAGSDLADDAQFIFHIGHVGSTLISRLLGESSDTLSIREPQILRQFADLIATDGLPHCEWRPGLAQARLSDCLRWLSRSFSVGQRSLIKATSFVSEIAPQILANMRKSVFLTLKPERYIQTILAGPNSRQELALLSAGRLQRLHGRLQAQPIKLWDLDEAKRAALAWATESTALERADSGNALWMDFDAFLATPEPSLQEMSRFLSIGLPDEQIASLVKGPIMQQYSKAPEHSYSTQLREEVLADAAQERRIEISSALQWLNGLAKDHSIIGAALDRAHGGN